MSDSPATEAGPTLDEIVALCKRRGFIFPSSEIYGGVGSTYDYGHYGVLLKNNVKNEWWRAMLQERDDIVAIDSAIIQHPRVWEASGHLAGFTDPMVDCKTCKLRFRADQLEDVALRPKPSKLAGEGPDCELTEAREFNLMFETTVGPVKDSGSTAYLRPETAQGIFINFKNVLQFARKKPPFGIAQIGKSFRNEITPGNFIFRTREFEQMEMEFFCPPDEAERWHEHWMDERMRWYTELGIRPDNLILRAHGADELSHYSSATSDIEYRFPMGFSELEGIANRGDFDLTRARRALGREARVLRPADQGALRPVRDRAGGRRRPRDARVHGRRLRRRGGRGSPAHRPAPAPEARPGQGRGAAARLTRRDARARPRDLRPSCANGSPPSTTRAARSASAIAARTRSARRGGSPSTAQTIEDDTVTLRDRDTLEQTRVPVDGLADALEVRLTEPWQSPKLD